MLTLARTMMGDPELVIIDEPTEGLAPMIVELVASFLREEHTDLIYPDPPGWVVWWFFNHPAQQSRIRFAQTFCPAPVPAAPPPRPSTPPADQHHVP